MAEHIDMMTITLSLKSDIRDGNGSAAAFALCELLLNMPAHDRMMEKVSVTLGCVVDAHSHIGTMDRAKDYLIHLDTLGSNAGRCCPNYHIPVQGHSFSPNDLVLDAVTDNELLVGGLRVSFHPQNREMTLRAPSTRARMASLRHFSPASRPFPARESPVSRRRVARFASASRPFDADGSA